MAPSRLPQTGISQSRIIYSMRGRTGALYQDRHHPMRVTLPRRPCPASSRAAKGDTQAQHPSNRCSHHDGWPGLPRPDPATPSRRRGNLVSRWSKGRRNQGTPLASYRSPDPSGLAATRRSAYISQPALTFHGFSHLFLRSVFQQINPTGVRSS